MSRRVSLGDLAERSTVPEPTPTPAEAPAALSAVPQSTSERPPAAKPAPSKAKSRPKTKAPATPPPSADHWQRFDAYERKESRLRPDQSETLGDLSRRLNRARAGKGERLTENTLIRVAIDFLVARGDDLSGTTEAELRRSLGL